MTRTSDFADADPLFEELAGLSADDPRCETLRSRIITIYHPLTRSIAARFRGRGESADDLEQVAAIGLVKAVQRYDPDRGVGFLGYAIPTMMGEVRRHFRDSAWSVRVPRRLSELYVSLNAAVRELSQTQGRSPTPTELAEHLDLSVEEVQEGLESSQYYRSASLDASLDGDQSGSLHRTLGVVEHDYDVAEVRVLLQPALATVADRERRILAMRFFDGMTQAQIAQEVGLSQMQVSRLLARTLKQLRSELQDADGA